MIKYDLAPNGWGEIWERYVEHGISPGSFGRAMLDGNLVMSVISADSTNINLIPAHVKWMMYNLPSNCWGGEGTVRRWIAQGGMKGEGNG